MDKIKRLARDYRGDIISDPNGPFVFYRDYEIEMWKTKNAHLTEVNALKEEIVRLQRGNGG